MLDRSLIEITTKKKKKKTEWEPPPSRDGGLHLLSVVRMSIQYISSRYALQPGNRIFFISREFLYFSNRFSRLLTKVYIEI